MKGFFKFTLASILGIIVGLFLFIFLLAAIIGVATSEKPVSVDPNTLLVAKFDQPIVDRQPDSPFDNFNPMNFMADMSFGLDMILENIEKAKDDDNIPGILMDLDNLSAGMATVEEIRNALLDFRESGKYVYSYAEVFTQKSYYLATASDKIFMAPEGTMLFYGLSSEQIFFKRLLDKLGIEAQVVRHGEYKSFAEPFIYEGLSEENRYQISQYLNSLWDFMVSNISSSRNIPVNQLNQLADNMTISSATAALGHHFVDSLIYYDEFINFMKQKTGTEDKENLKSIGFPKYFKSKTGKKGEGFTRDKIAIFYASGSIVSGEGNLNEIGSDRFAKSLRKARKDSTIKAIVLRVNSGGGSALASDIIWREVKLAAEAKPVVASMGDVAASGGYYIVAPATCIYADPNTITGSIGVIGIIPNMKEFLNDKIGITTDVVKTNEHADAISVLRPLDPAEEQQLQQEIGSFYNTFITKVAQGRGMEKEAVDKIARGHVYSAIDAQKIGLVDSLGGMQEAFKAAADLAGLEKYRIVKYPEQVDPFTKIFQQMTGEARLKILRKELGDSYIYYNYIEEVRNMKGPQARMPFFMNIY